MKRRILLAAALILAVTGFVRAEDDTTPAYITFSQAVIPQGGTGEMDVFYTVDENSKFKAFQINVPLPEGITIESVEMAEPLPLTGIEKGTYASLGENNYDATKKFFATSNNNADNKSVVIGFQTGNVTFPATTGDRTLLCTLTLKAAETVAINAPDSWKVANTEYIELTDANTEKKESKEQSLLIKVLKKGDVNGDGDVDVADIMCIINNIHNKPNDTFYKSMANVNQDDMGIDIADVLSILNIIHNVSSPQQAPMAKEVLLDPQ